MARQSRKKKRTHQKDAPNGALDTTPKSFVIRSGKITKSLSGLIQNVRQMMEPNTASRLKERHRNRLKDFVQVAGQYGVSHFLIFSKTDTGTNLRIAKHARGPTLTFRVIDYTLIKDVTEMHVRPRSPGQEYQHAPLLVLNNFKSQERQVKLMATSFQSMFPALRLQSLKLSDCRRVVMVNYEPTSGTVELRHYYITMRPVGVRKSIRRLLDREIPDLGKYNDISDYVLQNQNASEMDVEENGESVVTLPENYIGKNKASEQRAIRLVEIGPRMNLKLLKIEDGFCDGDVLFHQYLSKTKEEVEATNLKRAERELEKERRRKEQEENVERKKREKQAHIEQCLAGQLAKEKKSVQFKKQEMEDEDDLKGQNSTTEEESDGFDMNQMQDEDQSEFSESDA